ncbi:MAG: PAS domain-containing sensor histidine kinase [Candidatus Lokiarchaeota archaeon]|nr:PAS domain-containing sensor histidine kinase [Candidatus Lokiarchaeota archaeon]
MNSREKKLEANKFLDFAGAIIVVIDADQRISYINKMGCETLGYNKKDVIGKHWFDNFVPERLRNKVKSVFDELMIGKIEPVEYFENPIITKKGQERIIEWHNTILKNDQGRIYATLSSGRDVTERKKAEDALYHEHNNLINILNSMEDGVCIVNQQYDIEYVNPSLIKDFGSFKGRKCYEYFHDLKDVCAWCKNQDVFAGKTVRWEWYSFKNQRTYDLIDTPLRNPDGSILKLEIFRDITKQKKAEQKLKESEEKYRELVELLPDIVAEINTKLEITYANSIAFVLFGYSQEDFNKGLKVIQMIAPEDLEKASKNMKEVFNGEIIEPTDYLLLKKDGTKLYGRINSRPIYKEGKITGLRCVISDITRRLKAEEKIKESEAKYRDAYNLVSFYKDVFTHDMNNILQNILTSVELLSLFLDNPEKSEENKEILQILKSQVKRSANLILNVRKLTKLEETQIGTQSTEAISVLKKTVEFIKKNVQDREILIETDSNFEKVFIQANELLVDIFENILLNAVKYNDNPKVEILVIISKMQKKGIKYLKIEFKDNGIGITDPAKEIIFKGGYKRDKKLKGMGLGLSLVKKILASYNGEIWVEDRVPGDYSKGSNFVVIIPETV